MNYEIYVELLLSALHLSWHSNILFICVFVSADGDPDNYLTYFRRATVYLALGKSRSALPDLDKVVKLKPDFTAVSHVFSHFISTY